jgi:DNA primase
MDPDEFIIKEGKDKFLNYLNNPMNIMEFNEKQFRENMDLNNSEDLAKYTNQMLDEIGKINDDVLREISINKLVSETKLDKEFLLSKLKVSKKEDIPIVEQKEKKRLNKYEKSQQRLLFYMLKDKKVVKMYDKKITRMSVERYRHLAFQISFFVKQHGYINIADLMTEVYDDEEVIRTIGEITSLPLKDEYTFEEIDDYLNNIREYNDKVVSKKYKQDLKNEIDLERKLELAKQAIAYKMRSE